MENIKAWNEKLFKVLDKVAPNIEKHKLTIDNEIVNDGVVGIYNYDKKMYVGFAINQYSNDEGFGVSTCNLDKNNQVDKCTKTDKIKETASIKEMSALVNKHLKTIY